MISRLHTNYYVGTHVLVHNGFTFNNGRQTELHEDPCFFPDL